MGHGVSFISEYIWPERYQQNKEDEEKPINIVVDKQRNKEDTKEEKKVTDNVGETKQEVKAVSIYGMVLRSSSMVLYQFTASM